MMACIKERLSPKVNPSVQMQPSSKVWFRRIEAELKNMVLQLLSVRLATVRQIGSLLR